MLKVKNQKTSITNVWEHSSSLHLQMQVKNLPCKEETIYEHDPETPVPSLGPRSFKMK